MALATVASPRLEQRLSALARANAVRTARVALRHRIRSGESTVEDVLLSLPQEALSMPVFELLLAQRRWGQTRARKFLQRLQIAELRPVGQLTDRQRRVILAALPATPEACGPRKDDEQWR
jgi:hypothetical protein